MSDEQMDRVLAALRAGREFRVRSQDGWWEIRASGDGFELRESVPYEERRPPEALTEANVRERIGGWDFERVMSLLS